MFSRKVGTLLLLGLPKPNFKKSKDILTYKYMFWSRFKKALYINLIPIYLNVS